MYCLNCGYPLFTDGKKTKPQQSNEAKNLVKSEEFNLNEMEEEIQKWSITPVKSKDLEEKPNNGTSKEDKKSNSTKITQSPEIYQKRTMSTGQKPLQLKESGKGHSVEVIKTVMQELLKSISLELWLVNLLREGKIDERNFIRRFEIYEVRSKQCMNRRNEILSHARDLEAIKRALNDAKVGLEELEMRKTLGDVKKGEYEVKAPALKWDIENYDIELSMRKKEIENLENITWLVPQEEFIKMKRVADECLRSMDGLIKSGGVSSKTATLVKDSLSETLSYLDELS
jgi:hypothetical protein